MEGGKMSNEVAEKPQTLNDVLEGYRDQFEASLTDSKMKFVREMQFASQAIRSNDFLLKAARENPASLKDAIINVAAVGLSLDTVSQLAYLVPRKINKKFAVCLDISYKGLIKAATDSGSIMWAQCEIVRKNDVFKRVGVDKAPIHEINEFSDRGEMVGVYCVVKTHDGDYLTDVMTKEEIDLIKGKSEAAKRGYGPWYDFYEEMAKKTVAKRAAKMWPRTERIYHLEKAIDTVNKHEGIDFQAEREAEIEANDSTPIEYKTIGFLYKFPFGKFMHKHVKDVSREELQDYRDYLDNPRTSAKWHDECKRVLDDLLANWEMYEDAYMEAQGE